jgi:hypothetical protein
MKKTEASCKIIGVQLGEATISFFGEGGRGTPLKGKFALVDKEEQAAGYVEIRNWSERTIVALLELQDAMEEDALAHLFDISPEAKSAEPNDETEPPQF